MNKNCTLPHFVKQIVDAPVPPIIMKVAERLVDVTMLQILGKLWQACRSYHWRCMLPCRGIVEVIRFIPHECIAVVFTVPQFRDNLWESRSFFRRSGSAASRSRSWCASATDCAENVEVVQLVRTAVEQIVAFPMPQIMWKSWRCSARPERYGADCGLVPQIMGGNHGVFSWHVGSDDLSYEPSMTHSSSSSRAVGAGVARSFNSTRCMLRQH